MDKAAQWDRYSATLPLSRRQVIGEKYALYALLCLCLLYTSETALSSEPPPDHGSSNAKRPWPRSAARENLAAKAEVSALRGFPGAGACALQAGL